MFGLALDSKYITLVMTVAMLLFLLLYKSRIPGRFPRRELLAYFGIGFLCFLPVLLDLAVNNVNPFYFDLVGRFQLHQTTTVTSGLAAGGGIIFIGFRNFVQTFFRFSSGDIFSSYPPSLLDSSVWIVVAIFVFAFFVGSFFLRRTPRRVLADPVHRIPWLRVLLPGEEDLLHALPGPHLHCDAGRIDADLLRKGEDRLEAQREAILAASLIALTVTGTVINAFGVPASQKDGFGDWDDVTPIMAYINANHETNSSVAVSLSLIAYYILKDNVNVSIEWMQQQQYYYSESAANQSMQSPIEGTYPLYTVISLSVVERTSPQFVVIPAVYSNVTPGPSNNT